MIRKGHWCTRHTSRCAYIATRKQTVQKPTLKEFEAKRKSIKCGCTVFLASLYVVASVTCLSCFVRFLRQRMTFNRLSPPFNGIGACWICCFAHTHTGGCSCSTVQRRFLFTLPFNKRLLGRCFGVAEVVTWLVVVMVECCGVSTTTKVGWQASNANKTKCVCVCVACCGSGLSE